jgi:hypothetical protein
VLYLSGDKFPPDAQSSLTGKRHTARICFVPQTPEEGLQVSWSVRAAPTIQYLPCSLIPFAVQRLIEVASGKCPVQLFLQLAEFVRDPWFIELVAYLVNATKVSSVRPLVVTLVHEDAAHVSKELAELNSILNAVCPCAPCDAIPAPWRWYVDFAMPFEKAIFTVVLESNQPVIGEMFYSTKERNVMTFVDIIRQNERSDLKLQSFNGIQLHAQLPLAVSQDLSALLSGGMMVVKTAGVYSSSFFGLQQHPSTCEWRCYGLSPHHSPPTPPPDPCPPPVAKLSASQLCDAMFASASAFDFSSFTRMTDFPSPSRFPPLDIPASLLRARQAQEDSASVPPPSTASIPEICFFSPRRILKNSQKFHDQIRDVLKKQKSRKNLFNSDQSEPSPVKRILQRNVEKQEDLFEQRMHETVSAASKKPENIDKLKRLNSLTHAKRRLSSTKPKVSQKAPLKRDISGARRRGPTLERRHTVADSSEMALVETRRIPQAIPETPEAPNANTTPKMSGSEKKKILLGIVREELHKHGMQKGNAAYKDCIRKLHEMCRTLIRGMGSTREELMPHMKRIAAANATIVIDICTKA